MCRLGIVHAARMIADRLQRAPAIRGEAHAEIQHADAGAGNDRPSSPAGESFRKRFRNEASGAVLMKVWIGAEPSHDCVPNRALRDIR